MYLARFLVEDNDQDQILFDPRAEINIKMLESRFKQILGNYKCYSEEEEAKLKTSAG
jgi:hypothetical protein